MTYISLSAIYMYKIYVYMYDMRMICVIWILIQVYMMSCTDSITVVDLSIFLGGFGSALPKVQGNLSVAC